MMTKKDFTKIMKTCNDLDRYVYACKCACESVKETKTVANILDVYDKISDHVGDMMTLIAKDMGLERVNGPGLHLFCYLFYQTTHRFFDEDRYRHVVCEWDGLAIDHVFRKPELNTYEKFYDFFVWFRKEFDCNTSNKKFTFTYDQLAELGQSEYGFRIIGYKKEP